MAIGKNISIALPGGKTDPHLPNFGNRDILPGMDNYKEALSDPFSGELAERLVRLRAERAVLDEQHRLLAEELRTTSQRVNLFEKVKIPECREHIRVIRIFLGDEQTAGVARAKFAKALTAARQEASA